MLLNNCQHQHNMAFFDSSVIGNLLYKHIIVAYGGAIGRNGMLIQWNFGHQPPFTIAKIANELLKESLTSNPNFQSVNIKVEDFKLVYTPIQRCQNKLGSINNGLDRMYLTTSKNANKQIYYSEVSLSQSLPNISSQGAINQCIWENFNLIFNMYSVFTSSYSPIMAMVLSHITACILT